MEGITNQAGSELSHLATGRWRGALLFAQGVADALQAQQAPPELLDLVTWMRWGWGDCAGLGLQVSVFQRFNLQRRPGMRA